MAILTRRALALTLLAPFAPCLNAWGAEGQGWRVGVIGSSPPMSYLNEQGQLVGFNVELARALCDTLKHPCTLLSVPLSRVVDMLVDDELDFAAVSFLVTPERQKRVLFTKPYYRSLSVWLAPAGVPPGAPDHITAVVAGSTQARYAQTQGWRLFLVSQHNQLSEALASGQAQTALVPMLTAVPLMRDKTIVGLGLTTTLLQDPLLTGNVSLSVNPRLPRLRDQLDQAIDQVKRDGRFDRINSDYLPFKLQ